MSVAMFVEMPVPGELSRQAVRLEDLDGGVIMNAKSVERLPQAGVVRREQARSPGLDGEMEISNRPTDEGGPVRLGSERDLQDGLRLLAHGVPGPVRHPHDIAVSKGRLKLESKLGAILGRRPPKELGEPLSVDADRDFGAGPAVCGKRSANQMHAAPKK